MKRLILILLCVIPLFASANDNDTIIIKGYYVTTFLKKEIKFYYDNEYKQIMGKSYSQLIDYTHFSRFIPIMVDDKIVGYPSDVTKVSYNDYKNDSIYVMPGRDPLTDVLIRVGIANKTDLQMTSFKLSSAESYSPYYEIENNDDYFLLIVYLEGLAICKNLHSFESKWQPALVDYLDLPNNKRNYKLFVLNKITSYTSLVKIEGCKSWLPYIENK